MGDSKRKRRNDLHLHTRRVGGGYFLDRAGLFEWDRNDGKHLIWRHSFFVTD